MATICIKVGENATTAYSKYAQLSYHGDIVEVLPRKRRLDGTSVPDTRSPGRQAEREYLCLTVSLEHLSDAEFFLYRTLLTQRVVQRIGTTGDQASIVTARKRRYAIDFSRATFLTTTAKQQISDAAIKRRARQTIDLRAVNQSGLPVLTQAQFEAILRDQMTGALLQEQPLRAIRDPNTLTIGQVDI